MEAEEDIPDHHRGRLAVILEREAPPRASCLRARLPLPPPLENLAQRPVRPLTPTLRPSSSQPLLGRFSAPGVDRSQCFRQELLLRVTVGFVDPALAARHCLPGGVSVVPVGVATVFGVAERLVFLR